MPMLAIKPICDIIMVKRPWVAGSVKGTPGGITLRIRKDVTVNEYAHQSNL